MTDEFKLNEKEPIRNEGIYAENQFQMDGFCDESVIGAYTFRLDSFEGPLDVLLDLIRKSKLTIQEVKISDITEQYLEHIKDISTADLEKASEFISMAALLLEIKSKALLPKIEDEYIEEIDTEKLLIQKLEEYRLFKEASQKMREIETVDILFREPDSKFIEKPRIALKDMNKDNLMDALRKMFMKLERRALTIVERQIELDRFTVDEKMTHIVLVLADKEKFLFTELFEEDFSKSEIITTFQALLELMKMERVRVEQDEIFGEIVLYRTTESGNEGSLELLQNS